MFRQDLFDQIRPLDQAKSFPVKTILIANLLHLLNIANTIDIKMVKGHTSFLVDLHNGKGRAVHRLRDSEAICHTLGKYGLAYSQITDQRVDLSGKCFPADPLSQCKGLFRTVGLYDLFFAFSVIC